MSASAKTFQDVVANTVLEKFNTLPAKCKPAAHQWTPLAGIVVSEDSKPGVTCVALGYPILL